MTIGELARKTGSGIETIRYYELEGLLPKAARTSGNFRRYGEEHIELMLFIRHCRHLDMALSEIKTLLNLRAAPRENCGEAHAILDSHLGHLEQRIAELQSLNGQLRALREKCGGGKSSEPCGAIGSLGASPDSRNKSAFSAAEPNHVPRTHATRPGSGADFRSAI